MNNFVTYTITDRPKCYIVAIIWNISELLHFIMPYAYKAFAIICNCKRYSKKTK